MPDAHLADRRAGLPRIIQGGMGIGVSDWRLARAVAERGQLGVVSGTALDTVFVRRLQDGDPGGELRRAIAQFPIPGVGERALARWFRPSGRGGAPYRLLPMYGHRSGPARQQVTLLANFVEVWLAKEGHDGPVGINLLTKVPLPNLASLFGAMLAGVDCVLMGAGIPREIPAVLDAFAAHREARLRIDVEGGEPLELRFDPAEHLPAGSWRRPRFLAIVSSHSLAATLSRKSLGAVDGFVIEDHSAGGHNAPPRGTLRLDAQGDPIWSERDRADLAKIRELGLPFWLAGRRGAPAALRDALSLGAAGVQVGTLFAYADESGIEASIKSLVLDGLRRGALRIRTDPRASPTGFPFKLVETDGLDSQDERRERRCDLGYLRSAYRTPDGGIGYRCAAEPVDAWLAKGGDLAATEGRRCLCNGLLATIGLPQVIANGDLELPLLTSGEDLVALSTFLGDRERYSAGDAIDWLLGAAG